jgi:hypothetical protein
MHQTDTIFVMVDQLAIIAPAVSAFGGGERLELIVAKSAVSAEAAVEGSRAVCIVSMLRADGPERAVRLARKGARVVICLASGADRRGELRRLVPTSFILNAATADQLVQALRAGLSPSS